MIGRVYRANRVVLKNGKLLIETKIKSNMGGKKDIKLNFSLIYDGVNKSEMLKLEILDTDLSCATLKEKNIKIGTNQCIDSKWKNKYYNVPPLRKILKPVNQNRITESNKGYITIDGRCMKINISIDSINENFKDLVEVIVYPLIINNKEYLFIDSESNTPIMKCGNEVLMISKKDSKEGEVYEGIN